MTNEGRHEVGLDIDSEAAESDLADRRIFHLDRAQWDAFMAALSTPPGDNPGLRDLLSRKPIWAK